MITLLRFKRIRTKLIFWFLILGLVPLVLGITLNYVERIDQAREAGYERLITIRDIKAEQIEYWITNRAYEAKQIASDHRLLEAVAELAGNLGVNKRFQIWNNIGVVLNEYKGNYPGIRQLQIYSPEGILIRHLNALPTNEKLLEEIRYVAKTGRISSKFFYTGKQFGRSLVYTIPLFQSEKNKPDLIGIIQVIFYAGDFLNTELNVDNGLGATGEIYLVDEEAYLVNSTSDSTVISIGDIISSSPAFQASQGETGIILTNDYQGKRVIAAHAYLPVAHLGLVVKQDLSEINQPLVNVRTNYIGLLLFAVVLLVLMALVVAESISRPIIGLAEHAERIQQGEFVGNNISADDEIGVLAHSFNEMEKHIHDQLIQQQGMTIISESMVGVLSLNDFKQRLINTFASFCNASMVILIEKNIDSGNFKFSLHKYVSNFGNHKLEAKKWNQSDLEWLYISDGQLININSYELYERTGVVGIQNVDYDILPVAIKLDDSLEGVFLIISTRGEIQPYMLEVVHRTQALVVIGYSNALAADQLSEMANYLSETNRQLGQQTDELMRQSLALQRSAEELQRQNVELEKQRKEVMSINKMKGEFLSNMSHELRTPLHVILTLSGVIKKELATRMVSKDELEYLDAIERNGKILAKRINDILDLSRIEAGKFDLNICPVSVYSVLQNAVFNLQILATEKNIGLVLKTDNQIPMVYSDEEKLYHVFQNIVGNAIKFTDEGQVALHVELEDQTVLVHVIDTGIGIPDDQLEKVFDEFVQVDGSFSRKFQGSGLGLAIARKLMHLLGGKINISSELGKGSVFTVFIPVNPELPEPT